MLVINPEGCLSVNNKYVNNNSAPYREVGTTVIVIELDNMLSLSIHPTHLKSLSVIFQFCEILNNSSN